MATQLFYPRQVSGIAQAVEDLVQYAETDDEMVHVTDLPDGSDVVRVELTNPSKVRYVTKHGAVFAERPNESQE